MHRALPAITDVPRAQHCWCSWSGLAGPDSWDYLVKGKEMYRGTRGLLMITRDVCHLGRASAVCSTKLKSVQIWVLALAEAMGDGNGAAHTEAGFLLPKAMLASPHPHCQDITPGSPQCQDQPWAVPGSALLRTYKVTTKGLLIAVACEGSVSLQPRTSFGLNTKALAGKTLFVFCLFIEGQNAQGRERQPGVF